MDFQPIADYGLLADCNSAALVVARRVDRLALHAALRQPVGVRARSSTRTPVTGRSARAGDFTSDAPLPARHARRRDDVHDRHRRRPPGRRDGVRRGSAPPRPRLRRAARAAAAASKAWRARSSSSSSWPRAASTGSSGRCSARSRAAGARSAARTRSRSAPACRPRSRTSTMRARFAVSAGEQVGFALHWAAGREPGPDAAARPSAWPRGSRTPWRAGARGRPSTTSTRGRTASSCA